MSVDKKVFFGRLVKNEKIDENKNKIEISVDKKVFNDACDRVYLKNRKNIRLQGFRTGKVPRKVIQKVYGNDIFFEEAINLISSNIMPDIVKDSKLDVVGVENLNVVEADEEKGLDFTVDLILKPNVELKDYKGIKVKKPVKKITKEDIDKRITELRENGAKSVPVEDLQYKAKKGDLVIIDFEGFVDGVSFEGGKAKNYSLKLGSSSFVEGFEDQIIGHKVKDKFDVKVKFPQDYRLKNLRGKDVLFICSIKEIKKLELPKEDDEFAKDVSEFDSLDKLREDIEKKLKNFEDYRENEEVEKTILKNLTDNMTVSIPEIMIERKYEDLFNSFSRNMAIKGLTIARYFDYYGIDEESFKNNMRKDAENQVKTALALEKIIDLEKLKVEEDDFKKEWEKLSKEYKMEVENVKNMFSKEVLKQQILNRKAIEFLKENAKIEEEEVKV